MYYWKCLVPECEFKLEGTKHNSGLALVHRSWGKRVESREHKVVLVDENDEPLLGKKGTYVVNYRQAYGCGYITESNKKENKENKDGDNEDTEESGDKKIPKSKSNKNYPLVGEFRAQKVPLDPRLQFLYQWDLMIFPGYDNTFEDWLFECVIGFHQQNRELFQFADLFKGVEI